MSTTNHTANYELSQYIGTDVTSYLANYNSDMYKIDAQMKINATDAATANSNASAAVTTANTAATNASAAVSTANAANTTAEAAQTAAAGAQTAAGAAQTDAAAALRASASNTIGNLAPAYDSTLTYAVGDLVTYVDPETNQGKLYKNIIPIDVPEEFNINKWDDVTTSEVYNSKTTIVTSTTSDGVKTLGEILNELSITFETGYTYELRVSTSTYENHFIQKNVNFSNNTASFYCPVATQPNGFVWVVYNIIPNNSTAYNYEVLGSDIGITNHSSDIPTVGHTYNLHKIAG